LVAYTAAKKLDINRPLALGIAGVLVTCFERFGHLVKMWRTLNVIDGMIRHPFTSGGIIEELVDGDIEQACYKALHHQFVASASVQGCCGKSRRKPRWDAC
jgi:beta-glucosidase/6-phospho-beta-glucosidase/beta-galactosidase